MSNSIDVVSPIGLDIRESRTFAQRRKSLKGATLGLLVNGKLNAGDVVEAISAQLKQEYGVKSVMRIDKDARGAPVNAKGLEALMECDAVINGVGD